MGAGSACQARGLGYNRQSMVDRCLKRLRLAPGAQQAVALIGIPWILGLGAALVRPTLFTILLAGLLTAVLALVVYFFRDPERVPPKGHNVFLAPADGEVMAVELVNEPYFLGGDGLRISVFMSVLDVHVNRCPVDGQVAVVEHVPGQFLQAFRPESADLNEHNLIGLDTAYGKVLVKQIAGILARRIACWVEPGQQIKAGSRIGLIKLGSRVDLYLPPDATPTVETGSRTTAGETVVAQMERAA